MVSRSSGAMRARVDDFERHAFGLGGVGGAQDGLHRRAVADDGHVGALAAHDGVKEAGGRIVEVDLALLPVAALGLAEDDRVVVLDRLLDHPVGVVRRRARDTTRSPAVAAKYASGLSEWCSMAPMPPWKGMRITSAMM